jgi:hypothetical protein
MPTTIPEVDSFTENGLSVSIVYDSHPLNPRDWSSPVHLSMKEDAWSDDSAVSADSTDEFYMRLAEGHGLLEWAHENGHSDPEIWGLNDETREKAKEIAHEHYFITPVHCYQHSGIALSTSPFSSSWDAGHAGFAYVAKEAAEDGAPDDKSPQEWAEDVMTADVDTFGKYLNGEVYGYKIEDKETGMRVDSCYGFYDLDYCKEQARRIAESH